MKLRKSLSILLTICMVLTTVSPAFAEEIPAETFETIEESVQQEETTEATPSEAEAAEIETVVTEATPSEAEAAEAEEETEDNKEAAADIVLTAELDDVIVTLKADADAFDNKGELSLKVTPVEIAETDEEALDAVEKENVAKRVSYDITVLDDGEEIEPVKEVKVSFELKDAPSGADGVNIYHHDEEDGIEKIATEVLKEDAKEETVSVSEEKIETAETEKKEEKSADKTIEVKEVDEEELAATDDVELIDDVTVEATTDSFSLYTVDFTYKDKTISIAGDSTGNKLDDIVDQLGIEEKVEEATTYQDAECTEEVASGEVKEDGKTLFTVYEDGGEWYVDAVNAFDTEHGLVVKTADGAEYKIKVTDDPGETDVLHFLDWDATQKKLVDAFVGTGSGTKAATYTVIDSNNMPTTLNDEWYVVDGAVDYTSGGNGITVTGAVHLILKDGCSLTVTGSEQCAGICVTESNSLTIYAQSTGANKGELKATGGSLSAGIGGGKTGSGSNITINGGTVTAIGKSGGAGIGGGNLGNGSYITINGGTVTATGSANGGYSYASAGIGGGNGGTDGLYGAGSNITINGGDVTATSGGSCAGIGGGGYGSASSIFAADNVVIKADEDTNPPTTVITHVSVTTDIASSLAGKKYVTATEPEPEPEPSYLTFTAQEENSSVTFKYSSGSNVQYSTDDGANWTDCPSGTTINLANEGDKVSFKGTNVKTGASNHFSMTGTIAASGDVTSLTNGIGGDVSIPDECYYASMFSRCESLKTAPELPSTNLSNCDFCYQQMFEYCTSLTTAPALPAEDLSYSCYAGMFQGCKNLTTAPALPATTLTAVCYNKMFYGCTNLGITTQGTADKKICTLPDAEYIGSYAVDNMFSGTVGGIVTPEAGKTYYYMPYYAVTFDANGHGTAPAGATVISGGTVTKPADPTATGYTFGGWYKESGCTNAWDFENDIVTGDTTLYAKWTQNSEPAQPTKKSSTSSSWTSTPTAKGSPSAPISNGSWGSSTGSWKYTVNGEPLRNATAWIAYTGADGKQYTGCFYFDRSGNMATGWQKIDNIWYFFDTTPGSTLGIMKTTGWITTNGKQYYVGPDGKMLANTTTPDGHKVDATGARID